jgi:hypothetical protein
MDRSVGHVVSVAPAGRDGRERRARKDAEETVIWWVGL